jgi:hypothetical protein
MAEHYKTKEGTKGLAVVVVEDNYEDLGKILKIDCIDLFTYIFLELHYPRLRLKEAGYDVQVVGPKKGHNHTSKHGYWANTTLTFNEVNPADVKVIHALILTNSKGFSRSWWFLH